jgi:tetratricopeptide (TPR) repeat protein
VTARDARLLLARAYTENGRRARALEILNQVLKLDPSDDAAHGLLAEALAADGQWDAAIPHYRAFVSARPRDAGACRRLGGQYAHVLHESIDTRHDEALREVWLHGQFTYVLYRQSTPEV